MRLAIPIVLCLVGITVICGCGGGNETDDAGLGDATSDTGIIDGGNDADSDGDADSDTDTDADADADAGDGGGDACPYDPEDRVGWVRTWGGEKGEEGDAVAVGPDGTIVVAGYFQGTVDFDPGTGQDIHTSTGNWSGYVSKFSSDGDFVWARTLLGTGVVNAVAVETTTDGSIVIGGTFTGTVDFDPGPGEKEVTAENGSYGYVLKLSQGGDFLSLYVIRTDGYAQITDLSLSNTDDEYIAGTFMRPIYFDFDGGTVTQDSSGYDAFAAKLDSANAFEWVKFWGSGGDDEAWNIGVGPDDSVALVGDFEGPMDFDPGPGVEENTGDMNDVFLINLDTDGNYQWGKHIAGGGIEFGRGVAVDDDGNVYVGVEHSNPVDFDPDSTGDEAECDGNACITIAKYDSLGNFLWSDTASTDGNTHIYEIKSVPSGIVSTGIFYGYMDFMSGPGEYLEGRDGSLGWNTYVYKLLENGEFGWVTVIGQPGDCTGLSLDTASNENIVVSGYFYFTVDFDPTTCRDERTAGEDYEDMDSFLWRLSMEGNYYK